MSLVTVECGDLRAALLSVLPHVADDQGPEQLQRIHLVPGGVNVEVSATDRYTAALALVSVWESDGDCDVLDLTVQDVKQVLAVFPAPPKGVEVKIDIRVHRGEVIFTDVSGLVDGKSLTLPRIGADESFPDLRRVFAGQRLQVGAMPPGGLWVHSKLLHRFEVAQKVYGHPLLMHPAAGASTAWTIRCGGWFLGGLTPAPVGEDVRSDALADLEAWVHRLADVGVTIEIDLHDADARPDGAA